MRLLLVIFISLLLFGCSEEKQAAVIPPFEVRDISLSEKMKIAITEEYLNHIGLPDSTLSYLTEYYSQRDYQPRWINDSMITSEGKAMKALLDNQLVLGIPFNRTFGTITENFIQDEINITVSLAQVVSDLQNGFIDYETKLKKPKMLIRADTLDALLDFDYSNDLRSQFLKFGPNDTSYHVLGQGLIDLIDSLPLDTTFFDIESIKYDTLYAFEKTRIALVSKGYLKEDIKDSLAIINGLTRFQIDNGLKPDGVIGKYTSMALNESTFHKAERIILAMDKIRDREPRPETYIHINIPEYKLRYYDNDSLQSEHNIVVGTFKNQTPELSSKLRKIIVYPYWNVPYSISSKEILPHLKRSPAYMDKHNYKLFKKGEEVDPYSVDWKKIRQNAFPYRVRQEPGPKNSLGIIKFDFYNKHSVYFHDTPSKSLFGVDVRAYSHGCMRTQNPVDLAKIILERDEYRNKFNEVIPDSLDSIFARNENYEIKLLSPVPIYVEYQSATRKGLGIALFLDIYGRDEEYLGLIRE
ncbi:MAG: L,D-transpeptidase family protein [Crocinitomicaceae bacterium]|nr:L,D-transpeptidase family protein [Crocinitomicaceae bacterium]